MSIVLSVLRLQCTGRYEYFNDIVIHQGATLQEQGRRHGFEIGGGILRAERAKKIF